MTTITTHYLLLYINLHIETSTGDHIYAVADNIYAIEDNFTSPIISFPFYFKWHYSFSFYSMIQRFITDIPQEQYDHIMTPSPYLMDIHMTLFNPSFPYVCLY